MKPMKQLFALSCLVLGLLSGCATNDSPVAVAESTIRTEPAAIAEVAVPAEPAAVAAPVAAVEPAVGAVAFYRESLHVLDAVKAYQPEIQKSAEQAAALYCDPDDDLGIASEGSAVFYGELVGRSGGVMSIGAWWPRERKFRGVLLYCLRGPKHYDADLKDIAFFNDLGCKTYILGPESLVEKALQDGAQCVGTLIIPNSAVAGVSTYDFASVAIGWTWTCEFVAACTRNGKMPVMFQSIMVPTGMDRIKRNEVTPPTSQRMYRKFEPETIPPIAAGKLGGEWLAIARKRLETLYNNDLENIRAAARTAADVQANGGTLYLSSYTHVLGHIPSSEFNPPHFGRMPHIPKPGETVPEGAKTIGPKDFVLGVGYNNLEWDLHRVDHIRQSGAKAAWSSTTFNPERVKPVAGEIFITQPWDYGDADVVIPGYDVKMGPTSGLIAVEIYLMINAEINAIKK